MMDLLKKYGLSSIEDVEEIKITDTDISWNDVSLKDKLDFSELYDFRLFLSDMSLSEFNSLRIFKDHNNIDSQRDKSFFTSKTLEILEIWGGKLSSKIKFDLPNLKKMNFWNVNYTNLDESIGKCISLVELHLAGVNIKKLPNTLSNLTSLNKLIVHNKLENIDVTFPDSLNEIDFRSNKISFVPSHILSLPNIKRLNLADNIFDDFPKLINKNIDQLSLERTPYGISKGNIVSLNEYLVNAEISGGMNNSYIEEMEIYLNRTKKTYSLEHPKGI